MWPHLGAAFLFPVNSFKKYKFYFFKTLLNFKMRSVARLYEILMMEYVHEFVGLLFVSGRIWIVLWLGFLLPDCL